MKYPIILVDGHYDITMHREMNIHLELQDIEDDYVVAYDSDGHKLGWDLRGKSDVLVKEPEAPVDGSAALRANLIDWLKRYGKNPEADWEKSSLEVLIAEVGRRVPWY